MKHLKLTGQASALMKAWLDPETQRLARIEMVKLAENVLEYELKHLDCGCDLYDPKNEHNWSEYAYNMLLNDGAFEPMCSVHTAQSDSYKEFIEENGNEDDETDILGCYWITALTEADAVKYMPLIRKIMDIAINGL